MIRAVLKDGLIYPVEPLPPDWTDGMEMWVTAVDGAAAEDPAEIDRLFQELEAMVQENDLDPAEQLQAILREADERVKSLSRPDEPIYVSPPSTR